MKNNTKTKRYNIFFLVTILSLGILLSQCGMDLHVTEEMKKDPDKLLDRGRYYYSFEEYDLAIQVFKMVLKRYPKRSYNTSWAQYEIGMCYYLLEDYNEARKAFVKVMLEHFIPKQPRILADILIRKIDRNEAYKRSTYRD